MQLFYTVCNREEFAGAVALGNSIRELHPQAKFVIGWADSAEKPVAPEGQVVISVSDLKLSNIGEMASYYKQFEFICALRPWFASYLHDNEPHLKQLVFLAPSVSLYQNLEEVLNIDADFILTPHITKGITGKGSVDDKRILNIGMFHSDIWAVKVTDVISQFFGWWKHRTLDRAFFDLCNGMCMDQLWLNYAPVFVPKYHIIHDESWCVGLHNVTEVKLTLEKGRPFVNDKPLKLANYCGHTAFHPVWSDHVRDGGAIWGGMYRDYAKKITKFVLPNDLTINTLGALQVVSGQRLMRKDIVGTLKKMVQKINQFEI